MDERYDRVRMVRDKQFRYLYNYMPEKPYYQDISYRLQIPMMKELLQLQKEGKLDSTQMSWFGTKPVEELYDVENDPYELHNLANDPKYKSKLMELRTAFQNWTRKVGDMGSVPEKEMVKQMWKGGSEPPATDRPEVIQTAGGVKLSCKTKGASIGYQIVKEGATGQPQKHAIQTWDYSFVRNQVTNGNMVPAHSSWSVYNGEVIPLQKGDVLKVNAMRIGYKPAEISYSDGKILKQSSAITDN